MNFFRSLVILCIVLAAPILANAQSGGRTEASGSPSFSWENAVIYQIMTDRFANGDPANDHSYGRGLDGTGQPYPVGPDFFLGGDFAGLRAKVDEGYFDALGVNALWISAPYEQVHGFVPGRDGAIQSYAYHGYWPLDFTSVDANWGTEDEFAALVRSCHARGIRVIIDIVLNHPGYATIRDMSEYGFGGLTDSTGWQNWRPGQNENWSTYYDRFVTYEDSASAWADWWNPNWIRAGLPGYEPCGSDDLLTCVSYLPDFRTESKQPAGIPTFLKRKWSPEELAREGAELSDFFSATGLPPSPRNHLVKWLTDWIREYGIDGFRIDTARNVDLASWIVLKEQANVAYKEWQSKHPDELPVGAEFWMMGEVFGYSGADTPYFDNGFDALLNFGFQSVAAAEPSVLNETYQRYNERFFSGDPFGIVSYISSHDTGLFDRPATKKAATGLMLVPGGVNIFFGDETGRPPVPNETDEARAARGFMNWDTSDDSLLKHWQVLGQFRNRHPSIASGTHIVLSTDPYVFMRRSVGGSVDDVIVGAMGLSGRTRIYVTKAFPDDSIVRDAVTGSTAFVSFGYVTITADSSGLALLELVSD